MLPASAQAQAIIADGTSETAQGTFDTGTIDGLAGVGLYAVNGGTITSTDDLSITTGGNQAHAAFAINGSTIDLRNIPSTKTIATSGEGARGVYAYGNSMIYIDNAIISTSGDPASGFGSHGVSASYSSRLEFSHGTVTTNGRDAAGVISSVDSSIALSEVAVTTNGDFSAGLHAQASGQIEASSVSVTTSGEGSAGLYATAGTASNRARISGSGFNVSTTGEDASGVFVRGHAEVELNDSTIIVEGVDADAIYAMNISWSGYPSGRSLINVTSSYLLSSQGDGIVVLGDDTSQVPSELQATIIDSVLISQSGAWLSALDSVQNITTAEATVVADGSRLTGSAFTDTGSSTDVTFRNGTVWTLTGISNLTNLASHSSSILFTAPTGDPAQSSGYKTLTVKDYSGTNGVIGLNAWLASDNAPSDRLVINSGGATGNTLLEITNSGGGGELTTGNGIMVIDATNGATNADAFALGDRVAAGAYEYSLYRGSLDLDPNDQNWYLRSTRLPPVVPPPGNPVNPPSLPDYRAEVPVDMAAPALAYKLGLAVLGTWHDRAAHRPGDPAWGRLFGEAGSAGKDAASDAERYDRFSADGPQYSFRLGGVQAGADILRYEGFGTGTIGVYLGAGHISGKVRAVYGGKAGSTSMDAWSIGAYWTHIGENGWYVDGVLQGTRFTGIKAVSTPGETLRSSGWSALASLEAGYPIAFGDDWTVEPQAQIIYQSISLKDGADRFGLVDFSGANAAYGRIGGRLTRSWTSDDGRTATAWLRANLWSGFGATADTAFSALSGSGATILSTKLGGTWGQIGVGASGQLSKNVSLFGSIDYNHGLNAGRGSGLSGRAGMTIAW